MNTIIQNNPVLPKLPYTTLKPFHNLGPLEFYGTTRYEWAHRNYKNNCTGFGSNKN